MEENTTQLEKTKELLDKIAELNKEDDFAVQEMQETYKQLKDSLDKEEKFLIPVELIEPDPDNPLKDENARIGCADLIESFAVFGLISPLAVKGPDENGKYLVLAGNRRITAIKMMGESFWKTPRADKYKRIPCNIIGDKDMDKDLAKVIMLQDNLISREKQNTYVYRQQTVQLLIKMANGDKKKIRKIANKAAEIFKTSPRYARQWVSVESKGIDGLGNMVTQGTITLKQANKITNLDTDTQLIIIERIKNEVDRSSPIKDRTSAIDKIIQEYNRTEQTAMSGREYSSAEDLGGDDKGIVISEMGDIPMPDLTGLPDNEDGMEPDLSELTPDEFRSDADYSAFGSVPDIDPDDYIDDEASYETGGLYGFGENWDESIIPTVLSGSITEEKTGSLQNAKTNDAAVSTGHPAVSPGMVPVGRENQQEAYEKLQRDKTAKQIIAWCEKMMSCTSPTDAELSAIDACKKIADKFC